MSDFLQNLKVGDQVIVVGVYNDEAAHVERLTKTLIILSNMQRFSRKTGARVGGDDTFWKAYIEAPTEEKLLRIEKSHLLSWFRHVKWSMLDVEVLKEIKQILVGKKC